MRSVTLFSTCYIMRSLLTMIAGTLIMISMSGSDSFSNQNT
jgi:hypothetical protein